MKRWRLAAIIWLAALLLGIGYGYRQAPSLADRRREVQQLLAAGKMNEADRSLRRLLSRYGAVDEAADLRLLFAKLAHERTDWQGVVAALEGIADGHPLGLSARIAEGDGWLNLHVARNAEACWLRARTIDPNDLVPIYRLIYLYGMQLRREEWLKQLWLLYDRNQAGLREMIQLMVAGRVVWVAEKSLDELRSYSRTDRDDLASQRALGIYLERSGRIAEARTQLTRVLRRSPDDPQCWLALMECTLNAGDQESAAKLLEQAPARFRESPPYLRLHGTVLAQQGKPAEALGFFEQSLDRFPYDVECHHQAARAARLVGDVQKAERHARVAGLLARIELLCHTLHTASWNEGNVRELIDICERLLLHEEATGWVRVGLASNPGEPSFLAARERLLKQPGTSARQPPKWEDIP